MPARWFAVLCVVLGAALGPAAQPDVVLIVADDLGIGDVGYNGSEIATPHLDQMAAEGVVLDRFYTSPLCSPSRSGLLTGRYGVRMGIVEAITYADTVGLPQAEVTIAEALRAAGYRTALVGKWHLGDDCPFHPGLHGFDTFLGLLGGGANYFTRETPFGRDWWRGVAAVDTGGYTTELIADEAVEVLRGPRSAPLFLYLPFTAPHTPLNAPEADLALYPSLPEPRRTYAAMVTNLDRAVGRVLQAARQSDRPTLVWFVSDNGGAPALGGDNGALRGQKGQAWEGGIRVPSVAWFPGVWGPRRLAHPVWYLDVFPTLMGLAPGTAPAPLPLDGLDQGPQLAGAAPTGALLSRLLYSYRRTGRDGYWLGVQNATWKYVGHEVPAGYVEQVFNLVDDPNETTNVIASQDAIRTAFRAAGEAFQALTLPGASSDPSLSVERAADLSDCPGILPVGAPPGASGLALVVGPNPVGSGTTVRVTSATTQSVRVEVIDLLGRPVRTLYEGPATAQVPLRVALRRGGLPRGAYVVRVTGGGGSAAARVTLAR